MISRAIGEYVENLRDTDRRLDELLRLRKRQEAEFQAAVDYTFIFDAGCRVVFVSLLAARLCEQEPAGMEGKHWRELGLPEEIMGQLEAGLTEVLASGRPLNNYFRRPWNTCFGNRYYEYTLHPMFDQGIVEAVLCTVRDITHQMAIRMAEEKFSRAFNAGPNPMVISTVREGRCVEVNNAFLQVFGLRREETIGKTSVELGIWPEPQEREVLCGRLGENGRISGCETVFLTGGGAARIFLLFAELIEIDGEKLLISTLTDITARKNAEERFSQAFNANPSPMVISRFPDGVFLDVNEAWVETLGYQREEVVGRAPGEIGLWVDPVDDEKLTALLRTRKKVRNQELAVRRKDGQARTLLICKDFITVNGERQVLGAMTDVTQNKKLETELARLDRLTLIGEMAAGVAHEVRNPLTVIKGYLQFLSRKATQDTREQFAVVLDELVRVEKIIGDFISLARTKASEQREVDLNAMISDVFPLIYADAVSRSIEVRVCYNPIPKIIADEKEIKELILNLSRNGLEASGQQGRLTIATAFEAGEVILRVTDNGCGIPQDKHQKIFDPFYSTKDDGTGLGLAVCASVADRHGGVIEVESREGSGTAFIVKLPPGKDS